MYRLPGGTERVINTKSTTIVKDIIEDICSTLDISNHYEMDEFSLYCIVEGGECFPTPLIDVFHGWEFSLTVVSSFRDAHDAAEPGGVHPGRDDRAAEERQRLLPDILPHCLVLRAASGQPALHRSQLQPDCSGLHRRPSTSHAWRAAPAESSCEYCPGSPGIFNRFLRNGFSGNLFFQCSPKVVECL